MNSRIKKKIQAKKDAPWATRLHRGKAWHDGLNRWVRLWPDHPEVVMLIEYAEMCERMSKVLNRYRTYHGRTAVIGK